MRRGEAHGQGDAARRLPQAFLLDFDGVIVDSAELKTAAFADIYADQPPDMVAAIIAFQRHHGGVSRRSKFEHFERSMLARDTGRDGIDALCRRFSDIVVAKVIAAPLMPGARAFLDAACQASVLFLISGTPDAELRHIVAEKGLGHYFRSTHGAPQTKVSAFQAILTACGYDPSATLAIGDAVTECDAALALGIPFVGIRPPTHDAGFPAGIVQVDDLAGVSRLFDLDA